MKNPIDPFMLQWIVQTIGIPTHNKFHKTVNRYPICLLGVIEEN